MLKKTYRLQKDWQFNYLIKKGYKTINRDFIIYSLPIILSSVKIRKANDYFFGVSIPKKMVKKATKRNLYKRQVCSILNIYLKQLILRQKVNSRRYFFYEIIIVIRSNFLENNFSSNRSSLFSLLDIVLSFLSKQTPIHIDVVKKIKN